MFRKLLVLSCFPFIPIVLNIGKIRLRNARKTRGFTFQKTALERSSTHGPSRALHPGHPECSEDGHPSRKHRSLVLDMQRYFADPEGGYNRIARNRGIECEYTEFYEHAAAIVPNIQNLTEIARKHGMPVVHTKFAYLEPSEVSLLQKSLGIVLAFDDPQAEIIPSLEPAQGDLVMAKTGFSAFSNSVLEDELRARGIENLIITGVMTEFSVRATVFSALDLGFRPIIVSDGCAGITPETHAGVTSEMTFGMTKVRATGEILRYVKELEFDDVVLV